MACEDMRKARRMSHPLAIAFDLGGTQVRAALVRGDGAVLQRTALRTDVAGGPAGVVHQFEQMVQQLRAADGVAQAMQAAATASGAAITAIGVSAPGPLDSSTGVVLRIPTLPGWDHFALRDTLEQRFKLPVTVEGDGIAAANGEWRHGAGRGLDDLVYVTVSTGIGGGVVCDGRLLHGRRGMAAHVGHMRMVGVGPLCPCGAVGCFEALASGTALGREGRSAAAAHPDSALGRLALQRMVTAADVVAAARAGDAVAAALIGRQADHLGTGFTALLHAFSPALIIMGGGVSQAFDLLEPGIRAAIHRDAMAPFRDVPVVTAALGDNAGLVGAALLALEHAEGSARGSRPGERGHEGGAVGANA